MELYELLNPPAEVQTKKKYATFTVKEIGGPAEIILWRQQQEAKNALYNTKLVKREQRSADFERELGAKVDSPTIKAAPWEEKLKFALSERKRLQKKADITSVKWIPAEKPRLTVWQKIKKSINDLWETANFT